MQSLTLTLKRCAWLMALAALCAPAPAADVLTLEQCRNLALQNNKQLLIARERVTAARYTHKAARTHYLPRVSAEGSYMLTSREVSLLSDAQKSALNNLGTNITSPLASALEAVAGQHPELASSLGTLGQAAAQGLNAAGSELRKALRTNTRNLWAGTLMLTQPVYMGGKIRAYDRMTGFAEEVAREKLRAGEQEVILSSDEAYWLIVSLGAKHRLAQQYVELLEKLDADVARMIEEGVATRADGLTVGVRLNEAQMSLTKVSDGLSLARMALCQLCGLPLGSPLTLYDEARADSAGPVPAAVREPSAAFSLDTAYLNRPELRSLEAATGIYAQKTRVVRSEFLPSLAAMGGVLVTNPSLYNGFERKFRDNWTVGLVLKVPVFSWFEGRYRLRAAHAEESMARYELQDARERIELQVNQASFRVSEAWKKYVSARKNCEKANENLRTARVGFGEGVIPTSDLLAAQTAWVNAASERIDAQIDVRLTQLYLQKAQGVLR